MVVRVARFGNQPDRFTTGEYKWVLDTIKTCHGFVAAYHLVDDETRDSMSISIFENEDAARSAEEQVGVARERMNKQASPPDEIHIWRIIDAEEG